MDIENVTIIGKDVRPVKAQDIEALEKTLGTKLPIGYRHFVQAFGEGLYCDFFRIYVPGHVQEVFEEKSRWWQIPLEDRNSNLPWIFKRNEHTITPSQLHECIVIGDTIDGDQLVYHPIDKNHIYVLPRHSDEIVKLHGDFSNLHTLWTDRTPILRVFQSWHSQKNVERRAEEFEIDHSIFLSKLYGYWGHDEVLVSGVSSSNWNWLLVAFVRSIGGRIQVHQDEGVTHRIVEAHKISTFQRSGQRRLWVAIICDEDSVQATNAFLDSLEIEQLVTWIDERD